MSEQPTEKDELHIPRDEANPMAPRFDWRTRYVDNATPWDLGGAHPGLVEWLAGGAAGLGLKTAVVPGCGKGSDVLHLANSGIQVAAIDVVDLCAPFFEPQLRELGGALHITNFLKLEATEIGAMGGPWDLLYEHTIFCAIDPDQRRAFGKAAALSVRPGGYLVSMLFPIDKPREAGGPPHRAEPTDLVAALGSAFELVEDIPIDPHEPGRRQWQEHRLLFRRR